MWTDVVSVPYDVYDAWQEFIIVMPLWGVRKDSVHVALTEDTLTITWERQKPTPKDASKPLIEGCFWGNFHQSIKIPSAVNIDKIWSELTIENVLILILPKAITSEEIVVHIR